MIGLRQPRHSANGSASRDRQGTEVKVQIKRRNGSAVLLNDLMIMHTQPIHLLIMDPSLEDYHHENPPPTAAPDESRWSRVCQSAWDVRDDNPRETDPLS